MNLANPVFGWVAVATALVLTIVIAADFQRRRRSLDRIGHLPMLQQMTASLSSRRRVFKAVLWVIAVTLCMLAAARPQVPGESSWRQRGIDIAMVMDFSKSMMARDVLPSRSEATVQVAEQLIGALEADRVATVMFSGAAVHFPLTHDHQAAKLLYRGVSPLDLAPGSDLGEALRVSRCVLRPDVLQDGSCARIGGRGRGGDPLPDGSGAAEEPEPLEPAPEPEVADRARAIIVFTDGEDTGDTARAEVQLASSLGIHVFFVGVGTTAGELIPDYDRRGEEIGWKKHRDGSFVRTRLAETELAELAEIAGGSGQYLTLGPKGMELESLTGQLEGLKKGDLDQRVVRSNRPVFQLLLFPAFLLLLIEACMGERRRRRVQ